ncbi:MAG: ABC transporter permease [Acidobacteriota bacterium]
MVYGSLHSAHRTSRTSENARLALGFVSKALFVLLVFAPLCAVALELRGGVGWPALIPDGRRLELLLQSAALATGVGAAATAFGFLAALALWRCREGRRSRLKWLVLIMAPVPPYIHALAWATALRFLSTGATRGGPLALEGWVLAGWVDTMALLPVAVGLSLLGLEAVQPALVECGRVARSDLRTLTGIVIPLAAPGILASFATTLLFSLMDYTVPSIFGADVYALEIFVGYSASADPAQALLLAVPLGVIGAAVVLGSLKTVRAAASAASPRAFAQMAPLSFPGWFRVIERVGLTVLGLQILVPLVVLTTSLDRPAGVLQTLRLAAGDVGSSFRIAGLAAVFCLVPAAGTARALLGSRRSTRVWWLVAAAPLAVPAPLIGVGLIVICNRPPFTGLYDSEWMPVLAASARFMPWACLLVMAQLKRLDPALFDAARVHGPSPIRSWVRVSLPMMAPGVLAAATLVFALTLGELGATLLVTPPGRSTLTIRIYNYLHYGGSAEVATLCLVMLAASLAAGLTIWLLLAGWTRLRRLL